MSPEPFRWTDRVPWAAAVAVVLALILHAPAMGLSFLSDDFERIEDALTMAGDGAAGLLWRAGADGYYRPVFYASLAADHALWGLSPAGFHRTNIVLHLAVLALALRLAERHLFAGMPATIARWAAILAAPAMALYPHHVDAVAWISGRSGLLAALFALGSLGCYLSERRVLRWVGPLLLALAILSKESAFLLVLLPWVAGAARSRRFLPSGLAAYLAVPLVLGAWRALAVGTSGLGRLGEPLAGLRNAVASALWLLVPADLERLRELGASLAPALLVLAVVSVAVLAWLALRPAAGRDILLRGIVLAAITLLLPSLIGVRARYLYLPSLALLPALAAWLALRCGTDARGRLVAGLTAVAVSVAFLVGAVERRRAWGEASVVSERFLESLAIVAHGHPYRTVYVIGAPFTLRRASIAANWTTALRLAFELKSEVRVLNTVRLPSADWEGPSASSPAPGVVVQRLEPGAHAAFHYPGEAGGGEVTQLRDATVRVLERDDRGRVKALEITTSEALRAPGTPVQVAIGGRLRPGWE